MQIKSYIRRTLIIGVAIASLTLALTACGSSTTKTVTQSKPATTAPAADIIAKTDKHLGGIQGTITKVNGNIVTVQGHLYGGSDGSTQLPGVVTRTVQVWSPSDPMKVGYHFELDTDGSGGNYMHATAPKPVVEGYSRQAHAAVTQIVGSMKALRNGNFQPYLDALTKLVNAPDMQNNKHLARVIGRVIVFWGAIQSGIDPGKEAASEIQSDATWVGKLSATIVNAPISS